MPIGNTIADGGRNGKMAEGGPTRICPRCKGMAGHVINTGTPAFPVRTWVPCKVCGGSGVVQK